MRARIAPAVALVLAPLAGCAPGGDGGGGSGVVVTTNILGDVTRRIVGDEAEVTVLMAPGADPHSFGVSARQAAELADAELLVHNGLGLEEGVARHVTAAGEAGVTTLAVAEEVDPLPFGADVDGEAGEPDPHFWTDPTRMRTAVEAIAELVIAEVDGVDEAAVRANAEAYDAELAELDDWMTERFAAVPDDRRALVTNHHVFGYLADRYDFDVVGAVIPSGTTLASPSASDLESLATAVEAAGVPAIFADSSQPDRLARVLAEEAGLRVEVIPLFSESLTEPEGPAGSYLALMRANADAIADGLAAGPA
ncbi:zinc ABC transporter substrate-binding protein AztC [Streptomyces mayteni]